MWVFNFYIAKLYDFIYLQWVICGLLDGPGPSVRLMLLDVLTHLPLTFSSIWLTLTNRRFEQRVGGDYVYETVSRAAWNPSFWFTGITFAHTDLNISNCGNV